MADFKCNSRLVATGGDLLLRLLLKYCCWYIKRVKNKKASRFREALQMSEWNMINSDNCLRDSNSYYCSNCY